MVIFSVSKTLQISSLKNNSFSLGHSAAVVSPEGTCVCRKIKTKRSNTRGPTYSNTFRGGTPQNAVRVRARHTSGSNTARRPPPPLYLRLTLVVRSPHHHSETDYRCRCYHRHTAATRRPAVNTGGARGGGRQWNEIKKKTTRNETHLKTIRNNKTRPAAIGRRARARARTLAPQPPRKATRSHARTSRSVAAVVVQPASSYRRRPRWAMSWTCGDAHHHQQPVIVERRPRSAAGVRAARAAARLRGRIAAAEHRRGHRGGGHGGGAQVLRPRRDRRRQPVPESQRNRHRALDARVQRQPRRRARRRTEHSARFVGALQVSRLSKIFSIQPNII